MFIVYILKSTIFNRYYIGHTSNLSKRIEDHNSGKTRSTKAYKPWELIYSEKFDSKSEAFKREMQIKSYKSGSAFQKLLKRDSAAVSSPLSAGSC